MNIRDVVLPCEDAIENGHWVLLQSLQPRTWVSTSAEIEQLSKAVSAVFAVLAPAVKSSNSRVKKELWAEVSTKLTALRGDYAGGTLVRVANLALQRNYRAHPPVSSMGRLPFIKFIVYRHKLP